jgi:peptidylprolyl isomerase
VKEVSVRRIPALLGAAALLAATLAGCTAAPFGGCQPAYESGDASTLVTATGKAGSEPTVKFPTPLVAGAQPEATIVTPGDGAVIPVGAQVDYDFTLFDGKSGQELGKSGYDGTQFTRLGTGLKGDSVSKGLSCATVGSRIAVVSTWKQAKAAFSADASDSLDDKTTVVVVIDVLSAYLGKADGFNQLPKDGLPTVVTAVDGTPGITVLAATAPKKTEIGLIKGGDGATLKADDKAVVQYALWTWPSTPGDEPPQIGTTWTDHRAVTLALTSIAKGGGVPDGLLKALIGARVGSQVLVVLPPGDDSFPTGQGPAADDSTYIFVVDVLGIQKDSDK